MTETTPELAAPVVDAALPTDTSPETVPAAAPDTAKPAHKSKDRFAAVQPVLEKLFELYPHLFGQHFLPLKLGIFQELLAAHPTEFKRDALKAALGVHTRSTRYLQCVAAGKPRHDLQGQAVEDVAPEHVFLSMLELFRRRQARTQDDLKPKLASQLAAAYEASGLTRQDYLSRLPVQDETISALLDEAIATVDQRRARRAALVKAFEASGQSVEAFADSFGMDVAQVRAAVQPG